MCRGTVGTKFDHCGGGGILQNNLVEEAIRGFT